MTHSQALAASVLGVIVALTLLAIATIVFRRTVTLYYRLRRTHGGPGPCMRVALRHGTVPAYKMYAEERYEPTRGAVLCSLGDGHSGPCLILPEHVVQAGYHPAPF